MGLPPSCEDKRALLEKYLDALLDANLKFNLTAVRSREDAWNRHIVECAHLAPLLGSAQSIMDVGSGGGLPGLVLAICRPDVRMTLLEATEKKARFLESTRDHLGIANVAVVADRAEVAGALGSPHREAFDLITARAVAPLRVLLELTVPFARIGGRVMAIKGAKADDELREASRAQRLLKVRLVGRESHPAGEILTFDKVAKTEDGYPRRNGEPKRRPL